MKILNKNASKKFKVGQAVKIKNYAGVYLIAKRDGLKCLKAPGILGWIYYEPTNWNDIVAA